MNMRKTSKANQAARLNEAGCEEKTLDKMRSLKLDRVVFFEAAPKPGAPASSKHAVPRNVLTVKVILRHN